MATASQRYVIALGSNRALSRRLTPRAIVDAAVLALAAGGLKVRAVSPTRVTRPVGPSRRAYANAAALVDGTMAPPALLAFLQKIERRFGRRRARRWGERTLDLDIILWSGGRWRSRKLAIPHAGFRRRDFVLGPLQSIAPDWRDPVSGLTVRHLAARLAQPMAVDRNRPRL